jgi:DNA-directed RNA polymerase subunit E'/Rpb7
MEHTALFEERASLSSRDLRGEITDLDGLLLQKLSTRMENKCSRHGFILPGSMKILSRSMGYVEKGRFTGDIIFHIQAEGKVLNPPAGLTLEGVVIRKNKMGMYVSYNDAIRIILPRDLHIGDETFEAVQVGASVNVEIQKSRFQVNDAYILSVGLFRGVASAAPFEPLAPSSQVVPVIPVVPTSQAVPLVPVVPTSQAVPLVPVAPAPPQPASQTVDAEEIEETPESDAESETE